MQSLTGKVTGDTLTATEWNQLPQEVQNVIIALGQSLTDGDLNQLGKSLAGYAAAADYFTDSGTANAINLTPPGSLQAPTGFQHGMRVRYRKGTTNTSAVTIVLAGLASKKLLDTTGADLASGDQIATLPYEAWYDSTADAGNGAFIWDKPSTITNELPRNFIDGFILSNGTDAVHDINIAEGTCKSSGNDADFILASALGKQIDVAWAEGGTTGTPAGGFPTGLSGGVPVNNTWYRVFAIWRPTGQIDAGFDTSSNAANLLADAVNYTKYRQIGWIRYGIGTILPFFQDGDDFTFNVIIADINTQPVSAGGAAVTVTAPPLTIAKISSSMSSSSGVIFMLFTEIAQTNTAPSGTLYNIYSLASGSGMSEIRRMVDSSSQIRQRASGTSATYTLNTIGFVYSRGKQ